MPDSQLDRVEHTLTSFVAESQEHRVKQTEMMTRLDTTLLLHIESNKRDFHALSEKNKAQDKKIESNHINVTKMMATGGIVGASGMAAIVGVLKLLSSG